MEDDNNVGAEAPDASIPAPSASPEPQKEPRGVRDIIDEAFAEVEESEAALEGLDELEKKAKAADKAEKAEKKAAKAKAEEPEDEPDEDAAEHPKAKAKKPEPEEDDAGDEDEDEPETERDERGRFKAKVLSDGDKAKLDGIDTADDDDDPAPARFTEAGKKEWAKAPKAVREEIKRAISEMENGLRGYQAEFDGVEDFTRQIMRQGNLRTADVLNKALKWDHALSQDFAGAIKGLAEAKGISLNEIASQILGEAPNADLARMERSVAEVRNENVALKEKVAAYERYFNDAQQQSVSQQVSDFFAQHPDAVQMEGHMARMISSGIAEDLPTAYQAAKRFFGADEPAAVQPPAEPARKRDPKAQTQKASLSVSGSPPSGSNPAAKRPAPKSAGDAVAQAFAEANL